MRSPRAAAPSWELFAVFRFVACFGMKGLLPTAVALTNEFAPAGKKSLVLGAVLTGPATGTVVASLTSLALLESSGFRPVYAIGAGGLLLVPFAWFLLPESPSFLRTQLRNDEADRIEAVYGLPRTAEIPAPAARVSPTRALFANGTARTTVLLWAITYIAQFYPAATRATGLGWALAVGRIGAIAGPTYEALLVGFGGGVPVAAMVFAAPALLGAALMLALRYKVASRRAAAQEAELVA